MQKTILITGSTDGIGKLAAIKLAQKGHLVIIHGRKPKKVEATVYEIKELTKNDRIKGHVADFSRLEEVDQLAGKLNNELDVIDVLINNAGVYRSPVDTSEDGTDIRMVVNYLAPYLFTNKLLPLLQKSPEARIINVSSAAQSPVSLKMLTAQEKRSEGEAYAQSKLALTIWSLHLAESLPKIAVNAVNPGSLLNTNMVREAFGNSWSSADKGAGILYDMSVSREFNGITGMYYDNDRANFGKAHRDAYNDKIIEDLMRATSAYFETGT